MFCLRSMLQDKISKYNISVFPLSKGFHLYTCIRGATSLKCFKITERVAKAEAACAEYATVRNDVFGMNAV